MCGLHDCMRGLRVFRKASLEHHELLFLRDPDIAGLAHSSLQVGLASQQSDRFINRLHEFVLLMSQELLFELVAALFTAFGDGS
jgi:hypothetical protein